MKNNLITKISKFGAGTVLGLAMLGNVAGCKKIEGVFGLDTMKRLNSYCSKYQVSVEPYTGYDKYAIELKDKNKEKLKGIDYRDISMFLEDELNQGKMLMKNGAITLPDYDCD